MAPPIVFQTKIKPADECPFSYSTKLIEDEHNKMGTLKCHAPFKCAEELQQDKFLLLACPGDPLTDAGQRVFGLELADFNGNQGFGACQASECWAMLSAGSLGLRLCCYL